MRISELIDQLCIINIKLFNVCNTKSRIASSPENFSKEEMVANNAADIELCKQRASVKTQIDEEINKAILCGKTEVLKEIKKYG